jgi:hypothetical protein
MLAQEAHLLAFGPGQLHAFHQLIESFRVTVRVQLLGAEVAHIAIVLELVDGQPHLALSVAKVALALRAYLVARQGDCHGRQDEHDGKGHDQLDQRQSFLFPAPHTALLYSDGELGRRV